MPITVDLAASLEYRKRLKDYCSANVLTPDLKFVCKHEKKCRFSAEKLDNSFAPGQLSYVGDGYAAEENGIPMRILIVSIQVGTNEVISMERRREQILGRMSGKRNPHMRGVTRTLQALWNIRDSKVERIDDDQHVLEAYAMANSTLCSNLPTDGKSRKGEPTDCMWLKCSSHLRRTVELLEPTIIVTQGQKAPKESIEKITDKRTQIAGSIERVTVGRVEAIWSRFDHPSAWRFKRNYLSDVVEPTLQKVRELALSGGCK